jgi:hypothetical protein
VLRGRGQLPQDIPLVVSHLVDHSAEFRCRRASGPCQGLRALTYVPQRGSPLGDADSTPRDVLAQRACPMHLLASTAGSLGGKLRRFRVSQNCIKLRSAASGACVLHRCEPVCRDKRDADIHYVKEMFSKKCGITLRMPRCCGPQRPTGID